MKTSKIILCVDDNTDTCELLKFIFEKADFEVKTCDSPEEAVRHARSSRFVGIAFRRVDGLNTSV